MGQTRPLSVYFGPFLNTMTKNSSKFYYKKRRWCAWDSNPGAAGWRARTHPLSYGSFPTTALVVACDIDDFIRSSNQLLFLRRICTFGCRYTKLIFRFSDCARRSPKARLHQRFGPTKTQQTNRNLWKNLDTTSVASEIEYFLFLLWQNRYVIGDHIWRFWKVFLPQICLQL